MPVEFLNVLNLNIGIEFGGADVPDDSMGVEFYKGWLPDDGMSVEFD